jgi:hypothetical protein
MIVAAPDPLVLAKIFEGIAGMERVHRDFEFLAIARGMQWLPRLVI